MGGLVVALASGFFFFDPESGAWRPAAAPADIRPDVRFNDGKPDRQGRFWSGTVFEDPPRKTEYIGALYRLALRLGDQRCGSCRRRSGFRGTPSVP